MSDSLPASRCSPHRRLEGKPRGTCTGPPVPCGIGLCLGQESIRKTQGSLLSLPSGSRPEQTVATPWLEFTWLEVAVE